MVRRSTNYAMVLWLAFSVALGLGVPCSHACKIDPKDAFFLASPIGRATNFFFKNCSHYMQEVKPNPPNDLIVEFLRSLCDAVDICQERYPHIPFNLHRCSLGHPTCSRHRGWRKLQFCLEGVSWAKWLLRGVLPIKQMKAVEKMMVCEYAVVSSATVAKHLLVYGLKISG
ncbi:uncharacterized protein LOC142574417 isoform X1 [Dermacentor variabilis]|uniref:uncharacterized protein LOC142574417 isoform X1 n=1 Tax=Dermacentor variabilis TaxID=34621 RepID=UPI003F5C8105